MTQLNMDEEQHRLLDGIQKKSQRHKRLKQILSPYFSTYLCLVHFILVVSLIGNLLGYLNSQPLTNPLSIFPELRNLGKVISNHHVTNHKANSNFSGLPNQDNAAAWNHLLLPLYFNASATEIQSAGASVDKSVQAKDGGFIASLGVFHELHCLNRLRYFVYTPGQATNSDIVEHMG